jgi:hypothetical protein
MRTKIEVHTAEQSSKKILLEKMIRGMNKLMQRRGITGYAYGIAKKMMPKISDTERAALNAGTVGFDRNIFQGNPSLKDLEGYSVKHSAEEQG